MRFWELWYQVKEPLYFQLGTNGSVVDYVYRPNFSTWYSNLSHTEYGSVVKYFANLIAVMVNGIPSYSESSTVLSFQLDWRLPTEGVNPSSRNPKEKLPNPSTGFIFHCGEVHGPQFYFYLLQNMLCSGPYHYRLRRLWIIRIAFWRQNLWKCNL